MNIDDPEGGEEATGRPQPPCRTEDPTARRRYEFIAAAAMDIASKNPEGEVEKQILAAAEYVPAPLMPVPPDLFYELLGFLARISSTAADESVRAEARMLINKMRLHKPEPEAAAVPPEIAKEEKRKLDKRLAKKNGGLLGSAACAPNASGTSEHVQKSAPAEGTGGAAPTSKAEARRLREAKNQRDYCRRQKEAQWTAVAATPSAPRDAGPPEAASQDEAQPAAGSVPGHGEAKRHASPPKVTACPPALGPEEEQRKHGTAGADSGHPGSRQGNFVRNGQGKWEYDPEGGAQALCGRLGGPPAAGILPPHIDIHSAAQAAS